MQPLLVWNNTKYAERLAGYFGQEFVITNSDALKQAAKKWKNYSSLIVLCELSWAVTSKTVSLQALQGIELVKELRRQGVNLPIIFTSFLSRKQVYANKLDKAIINTVG